MELFFLNYQKEQWRDSPAIYTDWITVAKVEAQLLLNLQSRGRGFNDLSELEQKGFAHASWRYGQWLAREARKLELPVISARPEETLLQRLLSVADVE